MADKLVSNEQQQQEELHSCPVRGSINISSTSERHRSISDPERQSARRALNNMTGDDDGPLVVAAENKHRHTKTGDAERGTRRRPLRRGQSEQSESVIHFFSLFLTHTLCPVTKSNKLGPSTCRLACLQSISHASLCIRGNYTQTANVSDATNLARRLQSFAVGALAFACFGSVQHHHQHHHHQFRPHCLPTCYLNLISKHTVRILQSTFRRGSEYL